MKLIKTISLFSTIILFSINLYSQDKVSSVKNRLLIYNFITTDNYDNVKEKEKNYQYYSIVIPETISKSLNKTGNYEIRRETGPLSIETDFINIIDIKERKKYIKKLEDLASKNKSDYILTGSFNVVNKKLTIRVTIFDVTGKEINTVNLESDELGVQLQNSTDLISKQINENIENFGKINQERSNQSSFVLLYTPFSIITMGIDAGYLYIFGDWSSIYNDKLYYSPFIDFDLNDDLLLSMKITSIQTDSDDKDVSSYSQIRILSGTLAITYIYQLSSNFGIALSAGGGMTRSKITIGPDKPFTPPLSEKESIDPNIDISSYLIYNFSTVTLRTGFLYKRIFYQDEPMDSGVIFAGAGIRF